MMNDTAEESNEPSPLRVQWDYAEEYALDYLRDM